MKNYILTGTLCMFLLGGRGRRGGHECGRLRRRIKGCAGICARDDAGRRGKRA